MADICVFYAGEDRPIVKRLVKTLQSRWSVWWDQQIGHGPWADHVEKALEDAKLAIVVWSKNSITNEIVRAEAARAIRRKKPLLMLRISDVEIPLQFSQRSSVDAIGWDGISASDGIKNLSEKIAQTIDSRVLGQDARPQQILIADKAVQLPAFLRSVSSFETQIPPFACLEILDLHETSLILTSAYDMYDIRPKRKSFDLIRKVQARGALVIMDSGNYEAYRRKDFRSEANPDGWSHDKFAKTIRSSPFDLAFCFDNFKTGATPGRVVKEVVRQTLRDQDIRPDKLVCPIVHAPTSKDGTRLGVHLPEIIFEVAKSLHPAVVAVPERELGNGIVERARRVSEIRTKLRELDWYQPIHLLGTGNLWSIAVLSCAGADLFDGLEWCRTVANDENGQLYHFQQYDLFRYQARLADSDVTRNSVDNVSIPFAAKVAFHNLEVVNNWMKRLQGHMQKGSANTFVAQKLGQQFDDLREGIPEVFNK